MVKGRAHNPSAHAFEIIEHLVGCHLADQQEKCSLSGVQACRYVFHKAVVEADVSQRTSDSPGRSADRCTDDWHQKDQPDEHTPHGARSRTERKSTRLNSSHVAISYAVFCLKKKKKN